MATKTWNHRTDDGSANDGDPGADAAFAGNFNLGALAVGARGTNAPTPLGTFGRIPVDLAARSREDALVGWDAIPFMAVEKSIATATVAAGAGKLKLSAPLGRSLVIGKASPLQGVFIKEAGAPASETFTISLHSNVTLLSTTGKLGSVTGNGTKDLVIRGTLAQVDADLALLNLLDPYTGGDTISISAWDSLGGSATGQIALDSSSRTVSVARFESSQSSLDKLPGGFDIADTAANILADLAAINGDAHIDALMSTTGALTLTAAEMSANPFVAALALGGIDVMDSAANLESRLSNLVAETRFLDSIVSTSGVFTVNVNQALADSKLLEKVQGGCKVADSAAHIEASLSKLDGYAAFIFNVVANDGAEVTVNDATLKANAAILGKVGHGGFVLSDASATILGDVSDIRPLLGHIAAIEFTDASAPILSLSAAQYLVDASVLAAVTSKYILEVKSGPLVTTTGHGSLLTIDDVPGDNVITGQGHADIFRFEANFGTAVITDGPRWWTAGRRETIDLPSSEFANFAALQADASFVGGVTTITHGSDKLTIDGIATLAALKNANALGAFQFT